MSQDPQGFAFPIHVDTQGRLAWQSGPEKVGQNVKALLLTRISERVMRRTYGTSIRQLLYDPNDNALRAILQREIVQALQEWEPRAEVERVDVTQAEGSVGVDLRYTIDSAQRHERVSLTLADDGTLT